MRWIMWISLADIYFTDIETQLLTLYYINKNIFFIQLISDTFLLVLCLKVSVK